MIFAHSNTLRRAWASLDFESRSLPRALAAVLRLRRAPGHSGDQRERDYTGRAAEVVPIDGAVIASWTGGAAREVRIVSIEFPCGRPAGAIRLEATVAARPSFALRQPRAGRINALRR